MSISLNINVFSSVQAQMIRALDTPLTRHFPIILSYPSIHFYFYVYMLFLLGVFLTLRPGALYRLLGESRSTHCLSVLGFLCVGVLYSLGAVKGNKPTATGGLGGPGGPGAMAGGPAGSGGAAGGPGGAGGTGGAAGVAAGAPNPLGGGPSNVPNTDLTLEKYGLVTEIAALCKWYLKLHCCLFSSHTSPVNLYPSPWTLRYWIRCSSCSFVCKALLQVIYG